MSYGQPPMSQMPMGQAPTREVPGATASLVLGIISIVFNAPIIGLILALIGFNYARSAKAICDAAPGMYNNAGVAQAGYVCCIIGLILGAISSLCGCGYFLLIVLALGGAAVSP